MSDEENLWTCFVEESWSEEGAWSAFLQSGFAEGASPALLDRVRAREPLRERPPTLALYQGLMLFHQQALTAEQLEETLELNEALDRSLRADLLRSRFKLVR
jgi:hypothetical protein